MKKPIAVGLILLAFALAACSSFPQPTPIPTLTFTAISTSTLTPTSTPLPPTATPEGQPASEWNGIPIMPGAISGEGDDESYVFTIKATPQQIEEYYELELGKLGWQPFAQGEEDPSALIFMNDASETLMVNMIAKGDEALVLLVK